MEQKFKSGDLVVLRSGGPQMTVKYYEPKDGTDVTCMWFSPKGLEERSFPQDVLTQYEDISIDDIREALRR